MAIFLRILLLSLPVIAVIAWLRWRMKEDKTEEERAADLAKLQKTLVVLVVVGLGAGLGLKLVDDRMGDARTRYIPPHSEDGKVVPGRFVPENGEDEAQESPDNSPDKSSGEEEGKEGSEQDPS